MEAMMRRTGMSPRKAIASGLHEKFYGANSPLAAVDSYAPEIDERKNRMRARMESAHAPQVARPKLQVALDRKVTVRKVTKALGGLGRATDY